MLLFIEKISVPVDIWRYITYGRVVVSYRPEKEYPNRVRLYVGGGRLHCPWEYGTPMVDMLTAKLLLNSILLTPNAKCMSIDINNFYLNKPMPRYEYMRLKLSDLPDDVIRQ